MGLTPFQEHAEVEETLSHAEQIAREYLDLDSILEIAHYPGDLAILAYTEAVHPGN